MALITPAIPYKTIRDAIITLLRNNLATLNTGLTTVIADATTQIKPGNPLINPVMNTQYPMIMVHILNKPEAFTALGAGGRKRPILKFRIYGITYQIGETYDDEIMQLAQNIESVFRDNIAFNANISWSDLGMSDFGLGQFDNKTYVDVVAIDLDVHVDVK